MLLILLLCLVGCMGPEQVADGNLPREGLKQEQNEELVAIYNWLSNTNELHIHQLRGAKENRVFLHQDGHLEVVYDKDGNIVQDAFNVGSYNYANPASDPLNHFVMDMLPWIIMGNTREDPTNVEERLWAYTTDLCDGIIATRKAGLEEVAVEELDDSERRAAATFLSAVQLAEAEWIFEAMKNESTPLGDLNELRADLFAGLYETLTGKPSLKAE